MLSTGWEPSSSISNSSKSSPLRRQMSKGSFPKLKPPTFKKLMSHGRINFSAEPCFVLQILCPITYHLRLLDCLGHWQMERLTDTKQGYPRSHCESGRAVSGPGDQDFWFSKIGIGVFCYPTPREVGFNQFKSYKPTGM